MPVKGSYLAITAGGGVLLWAGLKGARWYDVLRQVIAGKNPATVTTAYPITTNVSGSGLPGGDGGGGGTPPGTGAPGSLASTFEGYVGHVPYLWGGASPRGWDCSGAFNYVANHDCSLPIPGYAPRTFTGRTHGPATGVYMLWMPGHATRLSRGNVGANDVCLWQTHMGVAVDNAHYVSAYDTQEGTVVKPIDGGGPRGELATFWRLR